MDKDLKLPHDSVDTNDVLANLTDVQRHIFNTITAMHNKDDTAAEEEMQKALSLKTAELLSNWYNMSTDLKQTLSDKDKQ